MLKRLRLIFIISSLCLIISSLHVFAQNNYSEPDNQATVILDNTKLFDIKTRVGSFKPEYRAKIISNRILKLAKDKSFETTSINIQNQDNYTDITSRKVIITTVTDNDARAVGINREELAKVYATAIKNGIKNYREARSLKNILLGLLYTIIATIILALAFNLFKWGKQETIKVLNSLKDKVIHPIKIQNYELLSVENIINVMLSGVKFFGILIQIGIIYVYLILISGFFPWTANFSNSLIYYLFSSSTKVSNSIIAYLPNLFIIFILTIITIYSNKFIKFIFLEIEAGRIGFSGFYSEWADTTSKIARFLITGIAIAIIFPFLPGAQSEAFKGLSIFLGVLISLGSTSAVANIIAGIILTYTRAFKIGDRLKISDTMGDVIEKTLLVTRIKTVKNEMISIPNSVVVGSHIINYSASAQDPGLILHTSVSIGYDAPWRKVHELLINAALSTQNILTDPTPIVLQTKLDDFYVVYQINALTNKPSIMQFTYSELHKNIQDKFNEAGIEIMSPHFSALRDGNKIAIPKDYIPENYNSPSFKINGTDI